MKSSEYDSITDELLSAYIDDAVTDQERALVEAAVEADSGIAWRLDTLQQTVLLLHSLPEIALPRSFVLSEALIADAGTPADNSAQLHDGSFTSRMASSWRVFWQSGSGVYRNLAASTLALLLVLLSVNGLMDVGSFGAGTQMMYSEASSDEPTAAMEAAMDGGAELASIAQSEGSDEQIAVGEANASQAERPASSPEDGDAAAGELAQDSIAVTDEPAAEDTATGEVMAESKSSAEIAMAPSAERVASAETAPESEPDAAPAELPAPASAEIAEAAPQAAAPLSAETTDDASMALATTAVPGVAPSLLLPESMVPPARGLGGGPPASEPRLLDPEAPQAAIMADVVEESTDILPLEETEVTEAAGEEMDQAADASDQSEDEIEAEEEMVTAASAVSVSPAAEVAPSPEDEAPNASSKSTDRTDSERGEAGDRDKPSTAVADSQEESAALAALPSATATLQRNAAAESPLTYPYPASTPSSPFFIRNLDSLQFAILGLFVLTILFGGLWWRSR